MTNPYVIEFAHRTTEGDGYFTIRRMDKVPAELVLPQFLFRKDEAKSICQALNAAFASGQAFAALAKDEAATAV